MAYENILYSMLGINLSLISAVPKQPVDTGKKSLKNGIDLVYLFEDYGFLYKGAERISDELFRLGGLSDGFEGVYCMLIRYKVEPDGIDFGTHVIVDIDGDIVLKEDASTLSNLYLLQGCIAVMNSNYYSLITGKIIVKGHSTIKCSSYLFVENTYDKQYELGVYKIHWETGVFEVFN